MPPSVCPAISDLQIGEIVILIVGLSGSCEVGIFKGECDVIMTSLFTLLTGVEPLYEK